MKIVKILLANNQLGVISKKKKKNKKKNKKKKKKKMMTKIVISQKLAWRLAKVFCNIKSIFASIIARYEQLAHQKR